MTIIDYVIRIFRMTFGIYGPPTIISNTTATTCQGVCISAISSNVVIASITINGSAITAFSAITLAQGQSIYGDITSVTLTSGTVIVYAGKNG